jgi:hypothetical protein
MGGTVNRQASMFTSTHTLGAAPIKENQTHHCVAVCAPFEGEARSAAGVNSGSTQHRWAAAQRLSTPRTRRSAQFDSLISRPLAD